MTCNILVTGNIHEVGLKMLQHEDQYKITMSIDCSREQLLELVVDSHVLLTRSETIVDRQVLDRAKKLKVIARAAVGVGNIDLDYATERGIIVVNTPGKNTNSAAELTWGLCLSMMRHLPQAQNKMKTGGWDRNQFTGTQLHSKAIGIVGLGNVGHRVAGFAQAFDMSVFAYDPYISSTLFSRYKVTRCNSLAELVPKVDILSFHVPFNHENLNMMNAKLIKMMKPGSYIINTARGGIVCEDSLLEALKHNHLAGVAIDTWQNEPRPKSALVNHERVWASPHIGASTEEAQKAVSITIATQIKKAISGYVVDYPVNLPALDKVNNPLVQPYTLLAEKLGSLAHQLLRFNIASIGIHYRGDLAQVDPALIRLGFMKGYLTHIVASFVSYVNAEREFSRLGLTVNDLYDRDFSSYRSALTIEVLSTDGQKLTVGGVVFDQKYLRITSIDNFYFEAKPRGNLLIICNQDRPGAIGDIGNVLARNNINIDSFSLSRSTPGKDAMAVIRLDVAPCDKALAELATLELVKTAKFVQL